MKRDSLCESFDKKYSNEKLNGNYTSNNHD